MKWYDVTEIVCGLLLQKKLNPDLVNPTDLVPPYNEIVPLLRDGKEIPDIVNAVGYTAVRSAIDAADHINGEMKPIEWVNMLVKSASRATSAEALRRAAKDLDDGKEVDIGVAVKAMSMLDQGYRDMVPMSEVEQQEDVWVKTGWKPIDDNIGGLVKAGLVVIGASPGVGKTTLLLKIANSMVRKYKKTKVAIFTLEMTMAQLAMRWQQLNRDISKDEASRIMMSETAYSVGEVYAAAAKLAANEKLSMIGIDFADLMVEGEQTESVMGMIYKTLAQLAKRTGVPVVLISQLSRATYTGGVPKVNHLRYSGMAEAMSALILLLYNPHNILADFGKAELEAVEGRGYIIVGKSRFGFKHGGPGGIQIPWDGECGWGDQDTGWFGLVV